LLYRSLLSFDQNFKNSSSLRQFIDEEIEINEQAREKTSAIHTAYTSWCYNEAKAKEPLKTLKAVILDPLGKNKIDIVK
jgi:hypothetical protein